jgi:hypothetical protein
MLGMQSKKGASKAVPHLLTSLTSPEQAGNDHDAA